MDRKGLAIWLLLCGLTPLTGATPDTPNEDRQQILALLAGEVPPVRLRVESVFLAGDLAAVGLPGGVESMVYLFERSAGAGEDWRAVARITAPGEKHFGDAVLLSPSAVLVAAPDVAGAGLGPGATYVFQRDVGGKDRWGLVAKLALGDYPPPGSITVQQLAEPSSVITPSPTTVTPAPTAEVASPPPAAEVAPPSQAAAAPPEVADPPPPNVPEPPSPSVAALPEVVDPPPVSIPEPPSPSVATLPEVVDPPPVSIPEPPSLLDVAAVPPEAADPPPLTVPDPPPEVVQPPPAEAAVTAPSSAAPSAAEADPPNSAAEPPLGRDDGRPASENALRYIAIANMREKPRALALATHLRDRGYPSEVHRNHRGFFVVTLARLPFAEARKRRDEAVAAGDVSKDAYLIIGVGFQEKISP